MSMRTHRGEYRPARVARLAVRFHTVTPCPRARNARPPSSVPSADTLGTGSEIQQACARALRNWQDMVADKLLRCGFPAAVARDLACTVISTLEGAEVAAQVNRSEAPLPLAGRHLACLVGSYR